MCTRAWVLDAKYALAAYSLLAVLARGVLDAKYARSLWGRVGLPLVTESETRVELSYKERRDTSLREVGVFLLVPES
jgi:hypothetical protein